MKTVAALRVEREDGGFMRTGLGELDEVLHGGLPHGGIIELVGPAGAGKTQFCLQSCFAALREEIDSAVYIDTVGEPSASCLLFRMEPLVTGKVILFSCFSNEHF